MPKGSYSAKQRRLAAVAPPRDKITAADLKKLRSKKKKEKEMKIKKELTSRQKTALANHKKKGTHTAKHMTIMKEEMLKGKTFMEAHRIAMRKKGK